MSLWMSIRGGELLGLNGSSNSPYTSASELMADFFFQMTGLLLNRRDGLYEREMRNVGREGRSFYRIQWVGAGRQIQGEVK